MDNLQKARINMVQQQIRPWDVNDAQVLQLMSSLSRELFVPSAYRHIAYSDTAIPLLDHQAMLSPKVVARALQALDIKPNESVLEIGTGTGYVTALLSHMCAQVYSVELDSALHTAAKENLSQGYKNVTLEQGDAALGWPKHAPYHAIFITGSYPIELPTSIIESLPLGGRCFAIIGLEPAMQATLFTRTPQGLKKDILFETVVGALLDAPKPSGFMF